MAELASGAVSSLLGVIRNEAHLLGGVKGDVQFIKEEMESMNSFLMHLARTVPPSGEHDEQVRTWMSQVRHLALDCNNCIDLYLYRGNPDIHLSKGGLWRYLMWTPWFLRRTIAQHDAAIKLRKLKERAREVGERRVRYGVEVPARAAGQATAGSDGGDQLVAAAVTDQSGPRYFEPPSWEDHLERKLIEWMEVITLVPIYPPSIAIMAPESHQNDEACALVGEVLDARQLRHVLVDIPAVHFNDKPLRPKEILYYILRDLQLESARSQQSKAKQQETTSSGQDKVEEKQHQHTSQYRAKVDTYEEQRRLFNEINDNIQQMEVYKKLEDVKQEILQVEDAKLQPYLGQVKGGSLKSKIPHEPLGVLLLLLFRLAEAEQDQVRKKKAKRTLAAFYEDIIKAAALKLKEHMVAGAKQQPPISLWIEQYEHILWVMFPKTSDSDAKKQDTTQHEDHIKEIADKVKQEILREVFPILMTGNSKDLQDQEQESSAAKQATITILGEVPISHVDVDKQETIQAGVKGDMIYEINEKIDNIKRRIKAQMKIKGIVDKIEKYLKGDTGTMIIIKVDDTTYGYPWEETRKALSLLPHMAGALIITTTRSTHRVEEYCCPQWEPIDCSLVGIYHTAALKLTSKKMPQDNYDPQIYRSILENCDQHEFCMKIFIHALYSNPTRSKEELYNLCNTLHTVSSKSLSSIAQKMIRFSYSDLPKEYKPCLLYLAIFPQGHRIRRSTLIGRWVVEGLITTEDWSWTNSVDKAEQCFEALINRWLVYHADIGVTGDIKSCMVGDLVHKFITTIAKKQRILQIRLSYHLARHFSIFSDLRLRGSDTVDSFLKKLSESSQFSLLKVLDLENCKCFGGKNNHYLKDICCKILLLKYLSLRGTDVTHLPTEINNLHELEVLDIRHTKVHENSTRNVRLLKLKRLLAGQINPSASNTYISVQVPDKIEKMPDMEVLSNVIAPSSQALKDIGALCQLRKLGVVIEEKETRLQNLLVAISNMHECLQSLAITIIPLTRHEYTPLRIRTPSSANNNYDLQYPLEILESLSINGTTRKVQLLEKLLEKDANEKLVKVTLSHLLLNQENLTLLAGLPMLRCVRLRDIECIEKKLAFKKGEFQKLKYFLVEDSNLTEISFEHGAHELEKIVLSSTRIESIRGASHLQKLEELELNNNSKLLVGNSCEKNQLTFNKDDFPNLKRLIVNSSLVTKISFNSGSATKLEKIIWTFTNMESLSGISNLLKLKELEFNGCHVPDEVKEAIKKHKNGPHYKHNEPGNQT